MARGETPAARRKRLQRMRDAGAALAEIGRREGVSRQAIHQLLMPPVRRGEYREYQRRYQRERYRRLRAAGKCASCQRPAQHRFCDRCKPQRYRWQRAYRREFGRGAWYSSTRYHRLRSARRCVRCGRKSQDFSNCAQCRRAQRAYDQRRYYSLREAGRCVCCKRRSSREYCTACRQRRAASRSEHRNKRC